MDKKFDIVLKWWQIISLVGSLVITLIYFVIDNINAHKTIAQLSESNRILSEKVFKLEGRSEGVNKAIEIFMENPPGFQTFRIGRLEKKVFGDILVNESQNRGQQSLDSK